MTNNPFYKYNEIYAPSSAIANVDVCTRPKMKPTPDHQQTRLIIEDNMTFINRSLSSIQCPKKLLQQWEQINQFIKDRMATPDLNLAVIGEFNAGKSTFINSLIRKELLSAKVIPSTIVTTCISYGDFNIQYQNYKKKILPYIDIHHRSPYQIIAYLTTNPDIPEKPQKVLIQCPAKLLEQGLVILDTPGTNSTGINHDQITCHVVQEEADACVFVFDINRAGSISTFDFIEQNLKEHLSRFLFVATKLDSILENDLLENQQITEQIQETVEILQQKISHRFNIPSPKVYVLAPKKILSTSHDAPYSLYYLTLQEAFENDLLEFIKKEKESIILNRLIIEEKNILAALSVEIEEICRAAETELKQLQEIKIPSLNDFLATKFAELEKDIAPLKEKLKENSQYHLIQDTFARDIDQMISNATSKEQLSTICKSKLTVYVSQQIPQKLKAKEKHLNDNLFIEFKAISSRLENEFKQVYSRLSQFKKEPLPNISFTIDTQTASCMNFREDSLKTMVSDIDQTDFNTTSWAIAGAVIGSFIPVLGTIAGGIFGGIFGSFFSTPLSDIKTVIKIRVLAQTKDNVDKWKKNIDGQLIKICAKYRLFLRQKLSDYYSSYNQKIMNLMSIHQHKLERTQQHVQYLKKLYHELENRKEQLVLLQKKTGHHVSRHP